MQNAKNEKIKKIFAFNIDIFNLHEKQIKKFKFLF